MVLYRRTSEDIDRGLVGHWPLNDLSRAYTDGIIAHFKMNDNAANTVVVDSKFGNNGTASANTSTLTAAGKINSALSFDGLTQSISGTIGSVTDTHTITAWIYRDTTTITQQQVFWAANGIELFIKNDAISVYGTDFTYGTTTLNATTWYHIAVTRDGSGSYKAYVNGALELDTSRPGSVSSTSFTIGSKDNSSQFFDGLIDDVRVYNRVLSAAEVYHIYNGGAGTETTELFRPRLDGIVAHYKLNDNAANTTVVDSVYANNGTASANTSTLTTTGKISSALDFAGTDKVTVTASSSEQLNFDNKITIAMWVKLNDLGTSTKRLLYRRDASTGFLFQTENDGVRGYLGDGTNLVNLKFDNLTTNWHHLVLVGDDETVKGYLDGSYFGETSSLTNGYLHHEGDLYIGGDNAGVNYFDGSIDDVRIYNRAITEEEVNKIYNNGVGTETTTILEQDEGTIVARDLANFNDGTITGATNADGINGLNPDAMRFDGVDDYVFVDADVLPDITDRGLTINAWIKYDALVTTNNYGEQQVIWTNRDFVGPYDPYIYMALRNSDVHFRYVETAVSDVEDKTTTFDQSPGDWQMVTCVFDNVNSQMRIYENGVFKNSVAVNSFYPFNNRKFMIGTGNFQGYFDGEMSNIRVYDRVLSVGEVKKLYRLRK